MLNVSICQFHLRLFDFHLFKISKQLTYQTVDLSEIVFAASAMQYEDQIYI